VTGVQTCALPIYSLADKKGREAVRHLIGVQFQAGALFDSMSVADNVAFPLRELKHLAAKDIDVRVRELLELVGLSDAAAKLPGEL
jgi:phospholipid/cholesterol/gamma-HCH transport system ATP-binding protein